MTSWESRAQEQNLNIYLKPILNALHDFFDRQQKTDEHTLIKHLQASKIAPFKELSLSNSKDLFSAHFLCMHALYKLKNEYEIHLNMTLEIASISIQRSAFSHKNAQSDSVKLKKMDPLAEYYLNPKHYFETQEADVNEMLNAFWKKYLNQDHRKAALETLELPSDASNELIIKQFRKLAQKHHPDKGGNSEFFAQIQEARAVLLNS